MAGTIYTCMIQMVNLLKQLTKGNWEVLDVKGFDSTGENLFYVSTGESPITRNLYEVKFKTGISKRITQVPGVHDTQVSTDGNFVIDNFSTTDIPRTIQLIDVKAAKTKICYCRLLTPLVDYATGKTYHFHHKK